MAADPFGGAKLAILTNGCVLTLLRDENPDIPFPGHWDLPGGGREGGETPEERVLRELHEEFGLKYSQDIFSWRGKYSGLKSGQPETWFFVAKIPVLALADIKFGDEGQEWRLMPVDTFLTHPKVLPHLAQRLSQYLDHTSERGRNRDA